MTILFDLTSVQSVKDVKFHGGGEYAKAVYCKLIECKTDECIHVIYDETKALPATITGLNQIHGIQSHHVSNLDDIQRVITEGNYRLFYSALPYDYYNLKLGQTRFVFTVHGLRPIEMPTDKFEVKYSRTFRDHLVYWAKRLFRKSYIAKKKMMFKRLIDIPCEKKMIVPSYHTKYAILTYFPDVDPDSVEVLYSPAGEKVKADDHAVDRYGLAKKQYLLLINGNRWLKNGYRAIKAIDELITERGLQDKKVVVLGVNDSSIYRFVTNKERFIFLDYVDEAELSAFYKNAFCLVYPSLNEGFGYPPIECMKYEVPVICSAITSITEVCGDSAIYFNPYSVEEMKNRILFCLNEHEFVGKLQQQGKETYTRITIMQEQMLDRLVKQIILNQGVQSVAGDPV